MIRTLPVFPELGWHPRTRASSKAVARINIFWTVLVCATVIKIILASLTTGSNDVLFFQAYAEKVRTDGAGALYRDGIVLLDSFGHRRHWEGFFHPPFIIHVLGFLNWIRSVTHLSFPFLFRLLSIVADAGSAVLIKDLLLDSFAEKKAYVMACLFAGAPLLIFLSGFHGNTDPVMIFFLILSVSLLSKGQGAWMAGAAFGMSCNIKIWPLILAPVLILHIRSFRDRMWFLSAAAVVAVLGSLPVLSTDPILVVERVLGYTSLFGHWGLSRLLSWVGPVSVLSFYASYGRYFVIIAVMAVAIWLHFKSDAGLAIKLGLVSSVFLVLTPGFGIQYLSWYLPWVLFLGSEVTLIYLIATGAFMLHVYSFWSDGFPWNLADSTVAGTWRGFLVWHELLCWLCVVGCLFLFLQKARSIKPLLMKTASAAGLAVSFEDITKTRHAMDSNDVGIMS